MPFLVSLKQLVLIGLMFCGLGLTFCRYLFKMHVHQHRYQIENSAAEKEGRKVTLFDTAKIIYRENHSVLDFYRGFGVKLAGIVPSRAVFWTTFTFVNNRLSKTAICPAAKCAIIGAACSATSLSLDIPQEILKMKAITRTMEKRISPIEKPLSITQFLNESGIFAHVSYFILFYFILFIIIFLNHKIILEKEKNNFFETHPIRFAVILFLRS